MLTGTLPFQADSAQETMIKRLTDDPMRLNDAMPGVTFPARLQEIMDKALARMPSDRYAASSEFAKDVTAVVSGMGELTPVITPDGATMLIDSAEAAAMAKTKIGGPAASATRAQGAAARHTPETPAPRTVAPSVPRTSTGVKVEKKKAPVLAIVGAVVVLGGVGTVAAVMFKGNGEANLGTGPDSASIVADSQQKGQVASGGTPSGVTRDTANRGQRSNTEGSSPQTRDSSRGRGNDQNTTGNGSANTGTPPLATPVDVADAKERLYGLIDRFSLDPAVPTAAAIAIAARDTALTYFNAPGIAPADKALAAYVVANAYAALNQKAEALNWARQGLTLNPNDRSLQALVNSLSGNP
jgi:hypothetical protein